MLVSLNDNSDLYRSRHYWLQDNPCTSFISLIHQHQYEFFPPLLWQPFIQIIHPLVLLTICWDCFSLGYAVAHTKKYKSFGTNNFLEDVCPCAKMLHTKISWFWPHKKNVSILLTHTTHTLDEDWIKLVRLHILCILWINTECEILAYGGKILEVTSCRTQDFSRVWRQGYFQINYFYFLRSFDCHLLAS